MEDKRNTKPDLIWFVSAFKNVKKLSNFDFHFGFTKGMSSLPKLSLKYQRFTQSDYKDIGIIKFEFVAKTQFQIINIPDYFDYFI